MKINLPQWGSRPIDVCDEKCAVRDCLHVHEDKGTFVPGRGYTSYNRNPQLVCITRLVHGCPVPTPEPPPEKVKCCENPGLATPRRDAPIPFMQRCRNCRTWLKGWRLKTVRALMGLPPLRPDPPRL